MEIKRDVPLKELTTFKIGGSADFFCSVTSTVELVEACQFAKQQKLPIFILGGGSNVLIPDQGFRGMVIQIAILGINFEERIGGVVLLRVGSGENWDRVVDTTVERSLYGLENLSAIPGSVGASVIQNIGAYGAEVKNTLISVEVFDTESMESRSLTKEECNLRYRNSLFKQSEGKKYIVTAITLSLQKEKTLFLEYPDLANYFKERDESTITLRDVRDAVISIRKSKLPDLTVLGTAGSFFKNPILSIEEYANLKEKYPELPSFPDEGGKRKVPAGWLIDQTGGFKGYRVNSVGVYEKQALVLVNYGGGSAAEVLELANKIEISIKEKTGITLEREVCVL